MAPRLAWNAIVKNESGRIIRCMESLRPHISSYAVLDTGSTDGTDEMIKEYFELHKIPGVVGKAEFEDFAQARNLALSLLRTAVYLPWDYAILVDADMQLVVNDPKWLDGLTGESYDMYQLAGQLHYQNRRLISRYSNGTYLTPTHEFLNVATSGCLPATVANFVDHADGANRPEKFKRDIAILKKALKRGDEPKDRIYYYLAQSYRDSGQHDKAAEWYQRRIELGGWAEEVWSAWTSLASCYRDMGNVGEFLRCNIAAYNMRPSRAESLYDIAKHFREKGENPASLLFSEAGVKIPLSTDALFVNDYVYKQGLKDEFSICAYYVPGRRDDGFRMCDELSLVRGPYGFSSQLADSNLLHYMQPLGADCPSLVLRPIEFTPEQHWAPLNPSICLHRGEMKALVRTVNYRMDEDGRYIIRATDGSANNNNPINTRNWLVPLDRNLRSITAIELVPRHAIPCEYPLVVGFEDARIFDHDNNLYISATVRQRCSDGIAEQTLARIGGPAGEPSELGGFTRLGLDDIKPMLRPDRLYEKNWMPIQLTNSGCKPEDAIRFLYRPGHVVDASGSDLVKHPATKLRTDSFSGGSQLISCANGWLGIIHEAHVYLDRPWKRYYSHRFVWYDEEFRFQKVSKPFFFKDRVIEFVAGLCWHPDGGDLIISFGFRDCEAWLARVSVGDVWEFLCQGQEEPK
jgi:tetratricopeptide (TPR) repeat protein